MTHLVKLGQRQPTLTGLSLFVLSLILGATLHTAAAQAAGEEHRYLPDLSLHYLVTEETTTCGIAIDSHGNRYLSDPEFATITVYSPDGELLTEFESEEEPCDLAVDASGAVYVSDGEGKVVKYVPESFPPEDSTGYETDTTAGEEGLIVEEGAKNVAVDPADRNLLVSEGSRISEYEPDGTLVEDEIGVVVSEPRWEGVDVRGSTGDVYAVDSKGDRVFVLDGSHGYTVKEVIDGPPLSGLPAPGLRFADLSIDQSNGNFYLNASGENGIGVFAELTAAGELVSRVGPWVGEGAVKLGAVQRNGTVAVDNGSSSPNQGDIFVPSEYADFLSTPQIFAYGVYAFAGELTTVPLPVVTNAKQASVTQTGATLKGSVDNEAAQSASSCKFALALASEPSVPIEEPACNLDPVPGDGSEAVQATVSDLDPGTDYVYSVVATNAGGTAEATPRQTFSTLPEPPEVTAVEPNQGPEAGGNEVTIDGEHLSGATAVEFGGVPAASFAVAGDTEITATAPPGAGTVDVTVTTAGGTSVESPADEYTYKAPVTLTIATDGEGGGPTPPTPPSPRAGRVRAAGLAPIARGRALVTLRCAGPPGARCNGALRLVARVTLRRITRAHGKRHTSRRVRNVLAGKMRYRIAAGGARTIRVAIVNRQVRRLLERRGRFAVRLRAPGLNRKLVLKAA